MSEKVQDQQTQQQQEQRLPLYFTNAMIEATFAGLGELKAKESIGTISDLQGQLAEYEKQAKAHQEEMQAEADKAEADKAEAPDESK